MLDAFSEPLWVINVELGIPFWAEQPGQQFRTGFALEFNRAPDPATLVAGATVRLDIQGTNTGRRATNVAGIVVANGPLRYAFVTNADLTQLIDPQAGENLVYTVTVVGTDTGQGTVKTQDLEREALDGNSDSLPGGDYVEEIVRVG